MLDTLRETPHWTFGGGTALAVLYEHRISYDVDIFIPDADVLTALSPNRNPATRALLGEHGYQFPGNYLKLELEQGEIDFVVGGRRTNEATQPWEFEGRTILIDTPWEAAIKKIFYRPSAFKVRDIFDLAAVIDHDGEKLKGCLAEVEDKLDKLLDRIDALAPRYEAFVRDDVNATALGRKYATTVAIQQVLTFLSDWQQRARPTP